MTSPAVLWEDEGMNENLDTLLFDQVKAQRLMSYGHPDLYVGLHDRSVTRYMDQNGDGYTWAVAGPMNPFRGRADW